MTYTILEPSATAGDKSVSTHDSLRIREDAEIAARDNTSKDGRCVSLEEPWAKSRTNVGAG